MNTERISDEDYSKLSFYERFEYDLAVKDRDIAEMSEKLRLAKKLNAEFRKVLSEKD